MYACITDYLIKPVYACNSTFPQRIYIKIHNPYVLAVISCSGHLTIENDSINE